MPRRKPGSNPPVRTTRPPRGTLIKGIHAKIKRLNVSNTTNRKTGRK